MAKGSSMKNKSSATIQKAGTKPVLPVKAGSMSPKPSYGKKT